MSENRFVGLKIAEIAKLVETMGEKVGRIKTEWGEIDQEYKGDRLTGFRKEQKELYVYKTITPLMAESFRGMGEGMQHIKDYLTENPTDTRRMQEVANIPLEPMGEFYNMMIGYFVDEQNPSRSFDGVLDALMRIQEIRDSYKIIASQPQQEPTPSSPIIPQELASQKARAIFNKAIEVGLMRQEGEGFKWVATKRLLAYFADRMSEHLNIGKGMLTDGRIKTSWKPFEDMFQEKGLSVAKKDYQREGQLPIGSDKVDSFF